MAFVVCQSVGLQNGTASQDYIQLWHGDADLLRENLEAVQQTAAVILGALPPSDSTQNAVANHEYCSVPITALAKSPTKPSKRFDAKSLEELAASFETQGILAPLLVRQLEESKYEVVAGARRLRAAKLAELEKLPVRVVKLTDAEAIEAQCVELSVVGKGFRCQYAVRHVVCI